MHFNKRTNCNGLMCLATGSLYVDYNKSYGFLIKEYSMINAVKGYRKEMGFGPLIGNCYRVSDGWITFDTWKGMWLLNVSVDCPEINMVIDRGGYLIHPSTGNEILAARVDMNELKLKSLFL